MATLTTILTGVQDGLASVFPNSACFFGFDPQASLLSYPPSDQFCVIQPGDMRIAGRNWASNLQGNGIAYLWRFSFTLWLYVRLATDEAHREDNYLTDQTFGSLVLVDTVVDTLQNYNVTDNGEVFGYELDKVMWPQNDRNSSGWAVTRLIYHTDTSSRSQ